MTIVPVLHRWTQFSNRSVRWLISEPRSGPLLSPSWKDGERFRSTRAGCFTKSRDGRSTGGSTWFSGRECSTVRFKGWRAIVQPTAAQLMCMLPHRHDAVSLGEVGENHIDDGELSRRREPHARKTRQDVEIVAAKKIERMQQHRGLDTEEAARRQCGFPV